MLKTRRVFLVLAVVSALLVLAGDAKQASGQQKAGPKFKRSGSYEGDGQNEVDSDARFQLGEPYKSMLQTGARFALAQTKIPNHINIDTAMDLLRDTTYMLSRPSTLGKVLKVMAGAAAALLVSSFFFPEANTFIYATWRDPFNTLNLDKYLSNGVGEKSVLAVVGSKTDQLLGRVGLQANSCREKSLCYLGEILKCSFPQSSDNVIEFFSNNFSGSGIKESQLARAFTAGFVDRNCTKINSEGQESAHSCLTNFVNSLITTPQKSR